MAYLTVQEIKAYLYQENVDTITRNDDTIVESAIDTGIAEAKGYLNAYKVAEIFGAQGSSRNPLLLTMVKDLSAFHILKLSNAGVHYEYRKQIYDRAVQWLKDVQKGNIVPDLPKAVDDTGTEVAAVIRFGSNDKKQQHF